jgi:hypothetical protein
MKIKIDVLSFGAIIFVGEGGTIPVSVKNYVDLDPITCKTLRVSVVFVLAARANKPNDLMLVRLNCMSEGPPTIIFVCDWQMVDQHKKNTIFKHTASKKWGVVLSCPEMRNHKIESECVG